MAVSLSDRYDGAAPVNTPRSRQACAARGITPADLVQQPAEDGGALAEYAAKHREHVRQRLVAEALQEYQRLRQPASPSTSGSPRRADKPACPSPRSTSPSRLRLQALLSSELRRLATEGRLAQRQKESAERSAALQRARAGVQPKREEMHSAWCQRRQQIEEETEAEQVRLMDQLRSQSHKSESALRRLRQVRAKRLRERREKRDRQAEQTRERRRDGDGRRERRQLMLHQRSEARDHSFESKRQALQRVKLAGAKREVLRQAAEEERARRQRRLEARLQALLRASAEADSRRRDAELQRKEAFQMTQLRLMQQRIAERESLAQLEEAKAALRRGVDPRSVMQSVGVDLAKLPLQPSPPRTRRPHTARPRRPGDAVSLRPTNLDPPVETTADVLGRLGIDEENQAAAAARRSSAGRYYARWVYNREVPQMVFSRASERCLDKGG